MEPDFVQHPAEVAEGFDAVVWAPEVGNGHRIAASLCRAPPVEQGEPAVFEDTRETCIYLLMCDYGF